MAINMYLLIMTLNVNGINAPIKTQSGLNWMKKKKKQQEAQYAAFKKSTLRLRTHID